MKNKMLKASILVVSIFALIINVKAANEKATEDESNYSSMQSTYNRYENGERITVNGSDWVTLYGKSECNGSSCTYNYAGLTSGKQFTEALSRYVVCSGGEKNITYQVTGEGGKADYMEDNKAQYSGKVYWSEDYYVTCTSEGSGNSNVILQNSSSGGSSGTITTTTTNVANNNGYQSSGTVTNPEQGVTEYFVILGIVAIISYVCMIYVKKLNIFKKI